VRFAVEFLRADNAIAVGGLTGNQIVCLGLLVVATIALVTTTRPARPGSWRAAPDPRGH
jgi:prolipoprotein diacylglyceryltransferase